ncbi:hypothetical protein D3C73_1254500 [compost metagenome]
MSFRAYSFQAAAASSVAWPAEAIMEYPPLDTAFSTGKSAPYATSTCLMNNAFTPSAGEAKVTISASMP